ncbi:cilia- and flagella-associated protein 206-like isoform X2 [Mytilus galloprovincialis]|uniref:cilia- and flagella-associated protein 206-like isoform X2 n=1 Tax=Mytilus galloprovincialis TaxID=29158 RepID=UPI003F7C8097
MHSGESNEGPSTQLLKESLINTRQHEAFLRVILPQFIHLSQLWSGFQDEMVLLSVLRNILASLEPFTRSKGEKINPSDFKDLDWLFPDTTKHFNKLPLQYRGYCAWALAKFDRLLLPSNPDIDVLRNKDHYYGFSNKQAATEFSQNPDGFIRLVAECAKRSPDLKQLLKLHTQFASITPYSQGEDAGRMIEKPIPKCDSLAHRQTHISWRQILSNLMNGMKGNFGGKQLNWLTCEQE